ncbi:MAG: hypothetical protein LC620_09030, partial [Halobacteriales archaeon]|nr:hypothetical protein [Halobacteriales archaeon]
MEASFRPPAQFDGEASIHGVNRVLLLDLQPGQVQEGILGQLEAARWTNDTMRTLSWGQSTVGTSDLWLGETQSEGALDSTVGLRVGAAGPSSIYIEAEEIQVQSAGVPGELLPRLAPGQGNTELAPTAAGQFLY